MGQLFSRPKYPTLTSAAKVIYTINGHKVNNQMKYRFFSQAQIRRIREDTRTFDELKQILQEIFCGFTQINENLYLTGVGGLTKENIRQFKIKCIINVTFEAPKYWIRGIQSIRIPVEESDPNIEIYFDEVSEVVKEVVNRKNNVVVHCTDGVNRSATIVLAILMKVYRMNLSNAYYYVKNKRPIIRPSDQSWEQLMDYEYKQFGTNTVNFLEGFDEFGILERIPEVYL